MCSGRVDMGFVLRAFQKGLDGVFIGGCHLGECNYITHGNYQALNMVLLFKRIMEHVGLNPDRLRIQFMSGSEANVFVESVNDFVKKIKELGPIGKGEGIEPRALRAGLEEIEKLIPYFKVANREKLEGRLEEHDGHEDYFTKEEVERLFSEIPSYWIDPQKCQACTTCTRKCPVDAIISAKGQVHIVDQDKCIKCGTCFAACPPRFGAVTKLVGVPVPPPPPEGERAIVRKAKDKEVA